jgi:hypothetical protein
MAMFVTRIRKRTRPTKKRTRTRLDTHKWQCARLQAPAQAAQTPLLVLCVCMCDAPIHGCVCKCVRDRLEAKGEEGVMGDLSMRVRAHPGSRHGRYG